MGFDFWPVGLVSSALFFYGSSGEKPLGCPKSYQGDAIATHGKNSDIPFILPSEEDSEVYSSVELNRSGVEAARQTTADHRAISFPQLAYHDQNGEALIPITHSPFSIGGAMADVHLPGPFVDDWHALIQNNNGAISVEDIRSKNGVFLRIENELPLEDHDEIAIGNHRFIFRSTWDSPSIAGNDTHVYGGPLPAPPRLIQICVGGIQGAVWFVQNELYIANIAGRAKMTNMNTAFVNDPSISVPHAAIQFVDGGYIINDLNSITGVYIRLSGAVELVDGDTFLIANTPISLLYP